MALDRGTQTVVTAAVFTALAFVFIVLRCISRFWIVRRAGPEDYLIIFAWACSLAVTVTIAIQKQHGLGRHADTVSVHDNAILSKALFASIPVYNLGLLIVKDSILYQYLRFFVDRRYRIAAWALIILICVVGMVFLLINCFSCSPIEFFWNRSVKGGHCLNFTAIWFSFSGISIVTDLAIWVLPIPVLRKLQLPRKQKISLIVAFTFGGFGCMTTVLRFHALYIASISTDITYDNVGAATWSAVELNVGIMCACIPAMRPLISLVFPSFLSTTQPDQSVNYHPSRGGTYMQHESVVELSPADKAQSEVSNDDTVSFEQGNGPNMTNVKAEWTITESQHV